MIDSHEHIEFGLIILQMDQDVVVDQITSHLGIAVPRWPLETRSKMWTNIINDRLTSNQWMFAPECLLQLSKHVFDVTERKTFMDLLKNVMRRCSLTCQRHCCSCKHHASDRHGSLDQMYCHWLTSGQRKRWMRAKRGSIVLLWVSLRQEWSTSLYDT